MEELSVDQIEENLVVCVNLKGEQIILKKDLFNCEIHEGDVVEKINGKFVVNENKTKIKRKEICELQNMIFKNSEQN